MVKDHSPTWRETFWIWCVVGVLAFFAVEGWRWMNRADMRRVIKEEQIVDESARAAVLNSHELTYRLESKPSKHLTARSVKPSKARAAATEGELDAMDAMKEGDFQSAAKILYEESRKPEPWMIKARKKAGDPNPDAPIGPSWDEIEALKPEVKK